jgi:hypothetical protein
MTLLGCTASLTIPETAPAQDSSSAEIIIEDTGNNETSEDYNQPGAYEITIESNVASVTNCANMNYSIYTPIGRSNPPVVILGHGFARGSDTMVGWAEHLSSWGIEVLLPSLCHYNVFAGVDHEMNGQNMKELGVLHGATNIIYAGHSAGGLAAIIASSLDEASLGVLGLDTTDTENVPGVPDYIGQQYANTIHGVGFFIQGEPSSCNAENNGLTLFEMMDESYIVKVDGADHCDFEYPTDFICEMNCENTNTDITDEYIRTSIVTIGTSAILLLSE